MVKARFHGGNGPYQINRSRSGRPETTRGRRRRTTSGVAIPLAHPFRKYVFLNVFRHGAGGLEHLNSTLLTSSPTMTGGGDMRWLGTPALRAHPARDERPQEPRRSHAPRIRALQWRARLHAGEWVATASEVAERTSPASSTKCCKRPMSWITRKRWTGSGLRFAPSTGPAHAWTLEVRPDATPAQRARLDAMTRPCAD